MPAPNQECALTVAFDQFAKPSVEDRNLRQAFMVDVLEAISSAWLRNGEKHPGLRCRAYLSDPTSPDLPAAAGKRLRLIDGGKA